MQASELDKIFDDNQDDILEYFDTSKIRMINEEPKPDNPVKTHSAKIKTHPIQNPSEMTTLISFTVGWG